MNGVIFQISPEEIMQVGFSWSYCRNVGIGKILTKAYNDVLKHSINRKHTIRIWTADYPKKYYGEPDITSEDVIDLETVSPVFDNTNLFPDFAHGNWWDMEMEDFDAFSQEIRNNNSVKNIKDPRLFWIGNDMTSFNRNTYLSLCNQFTEKMHGISMKNWKEVADGGRTKPDYFVPIKDHCSYKYVIDIAGHGYGSRIKFLPFCNRPMFVNKRHYFTWSCVEVLKHNLHIPVREDLADLTEKFDWAESNQDLVFSNAEKLLNLCVDSLSFKNACEQASKVIISKVNEPKSKI